MTLYRLARREHKLENQASVAIFDKVSTWMRDIRVMQEQLPRITIISILRLELNS